MMSKYFLAAGIAGTAFGGCVKEEVIYVTPQNFCAEIAVDYSEASRMQLYDASETKVGLPVSFRICQPQDPRFDYSWDFGDGNSSDVDNPEHIYTKKGTYTASLFVKKNGVTMDTIQRTIRIYVGDQFYSLDQKDDVYGVDLTETVDGGALILGYKQPSSTAGKRQYFLLKLNQALQQQWVKDFPPNAVNLFSIEPLSSGRFILTGNMTGVLGQFGLICVDDQGGIAWNKVYNLSNSTNTYAKATPDNGIITVGQQALLQGVDTVELRTLVLKTLSDGTTVWEKVYAGAESISGAENLVVGDDGFVLAGIKPGAGCGGSCDSIQLIKASTANGTTLWSRTQRWYNRQPLGNTRIARIADQFALINKKDKAFFTFNADGSFRDRQESYNADRHFYHTSTSDGKLFLLRQNTAWIGDGSMMKSSPGGEIIWQKRIGQPVAARLFSDGNLVVLGIHNESAYPAIGPLKIFVRKLDNQGKTY